MNHKLKYWNHILNGTIEKIYKPHPLEGKQDNQSYIKTLSNSLSNTSWNKVITNTKSQIYKLTFSKNISYEIFIEHCDGGGREDAKKISIPSNEEFKNKIRNVEPVMVINVYYYLTKKDDEFAIDKDNFVYLIIKPSDIVESDIMEKGNKSPSSRWVNLRQIIECIKLKNEKNYIFNNRNNVYVIHPSNINKFLTSEFYNNQYLVMSKYFYNLNDNEKRGWDKYKKLAKIFRQMLAFERKLKCEWINCDVTISELIVASHIKAQKFIKNDKKLNDEEKLKQIIDPNNGFLLCKRHDAMFDRHLFTISEKGMVESFNSEIKRLLKSFCGLKDDKKPVLKIKPGMEKYLKQHHNETLKKSNKLDNNL